MNNAIYQTKLYYTWDNIKISSLFLSNGFVGILPILDDEINNEGDFVIFWFL